MRSFRSFVGNQARHVAFWQPVAASYEIAVPELTFAFVTAVYDAVNLPFDVLGVHRSPNRCRFVRKENIDHWQRRPSGCLDHIVSMTSPARREYYISISIPSDALVPSPNLDIHC